MTQTETVTALLAELSENHDPAVRSVNERHGDDHGIKLAVLRGIAKRLKTQHGLAVDLWATGDSAARLLALLICRPKDYPTADLDAMLRDARTSKVTDWLVGNVVGKSPHREQLRIEWMDDADPAVAAAAWSLTADRIAKGGAEGLDLPALLDAIDAQMATAPDRLQWAMNATLAQIGINHPDLRERALEIGERLGVLKDYPTPRGCTSPYAPLWIAEMVKRAEA